MTMQSDVLASTTNTNELCVSNKPLLVSTRTILNPQLYVALAPYMVHHMMRPSALMVGNSACFLLLL